MSMLVGTTTVWRARVAESCEVLCVSVMEAPCYAPGGRRSQRITPVGVRAE